MPFRARKFSQKTRARYQRLTPSLVYPAGVHILRQAPLLPPLHMSGSAVHLLTPAAGSSCSTSTSAGTFGFLPRMTIRTPCRQASAWPRRGRQISRRHPMLQGICCPHVPGGRAPRPRSPRLGAARGDREGPSRPPSSTSPTATFCRPRPPSWRRRRRRRTASGRWWWWPRQPSRSRDDGGLRDRVLVRSNRPRNGRRDRSAPC
jgi:hypothetical protein